jgi:dihydropyrimidine dehydrogenase (NAD+) subunit PreT
VFKAIGQSFPPTRDEQVSLELERGKIKVDRAAALGRGVWAGGDCVAGGEDLTVVAVAARTEAAGHLTRFARPANRAE